MSLLEIKQEVTKLSPHERRELNAYLVRLRNESEEGQTRLSEHMTAMDAGRKVSMAELGDRIVARHGEQL
jgi:hypothetical protein